MRYLILFLALVLIAPASVLAQAQAIYPRGTATVVVPAGQSVDVFSRGSGEGVKVYKASGGPDSNSPSLFKPETTNGGVVQNAEVTFGPYTNGTTLKLFAGADMGWYQVGANAAIIPIAAPNANVEVRGQYAPIAYTTSQTMLATDLLNGLITVTHAAGATQTYTLPTGTLMDAAAGLQVNQGFEWELINLSGTPGTNTATIAAGTGHTIVGEAIVGLSQLNGTNSSRWLTRKTAANTFVTYRLK